MRLTIEGHPEEKPVGDVHHYGSQQIENVHVSAGVSHLLQNIQVFGCGAHTDPNRHLEAGACQSCQTTTEQEDTIQLYTVSVKYMSFSFLCGFRPRL